MQTPDYVIARNAQVAPRRFLAEPAVPSAFAPFDMPTTTVTKMEDGRTVAIEQRPEKAHTGAEFRAFFPSSPNGIDAVATTETGAIEALADADREEVERRAEMIEEGEAPWWLA